MWQPSSPGCLPLLYKDVDGASKAAKISVVGCKNPHKVLQLYSHNVTQWIHFWLECDINIPTTAVKSTETCSCFALVLRWELTKLRSVWLHNYNCGPVMEQGQEQINTSCLWSNLNSESKSQCWHAWLMWPVFGYSPVSVFFRFA